MAYSASHIACTMSECVIGCPIKKPHANVREQLLRIMQIRRRTAASRGRIVSNVLHLSCMH